MFQVIAAGTQQRPTATDLPTQAHTGQLNTLGVSDALPTDSRIHQVQTTPQPNRTATSTPVGWKTQST